MSLNKHVVWITPGFAASEEDDTCIPTLQDLLQYMEAHKNITVSIITLQYPFTNQHYQIYGATVYPLNGRNKWIYKLSVWKNSIRTLNDLHAKQPIDFIHSFWLGDTALIGESFAKPNKIKHICTLMGQDVLKENRHLHNKRLKDIPLIALSVFQAEIFFKNTGRRVNQIIPFGMPKAALDYPKKKYDIIGVGSLIPVKNYEMWIEIIALVKKRSPNLKAIIVGEGEERADLSSLIEKKHLDSTIELMGHRKRKEVLELMSESKLFVHTAKHEGQGYVFFEAMNKKLPILSTPVGYAIENEKIWKGIDPSKFADEIIHLLGNDNPRINYQFPDVEETFNKYWAFYKTS